jgi:hypothetical protein
VFCCEVTDIRRACAIKEDLGQLGLVCIEKADNPIVDVMNVNNVQRYDWY